MDKIELKDIFKIKNFTFNSKKVEDILKNEDIESAELLWNKWAKVNNHYIALLMAHIDTHEVICDEPYIMNPLNFWGELIELQKNKVYIVMENTKNLNIKKSFLHINIKDSYDYDYDYDYDKYGNDTTFYINDCNLLNCFNEKKYKYTYVNLKERGDFISVNTNNTGISTLIKLLELYKDSFKVVFCKFKILVRDYNNGTTSLNIEEIFLLEKWIKNNNKYIIYDKDYHYVVA